MQQIQTSVDEVRSRLIDLETRTGAAVTQGAARIKETAEEVVKTGEYLRAVDVAAANAMQSVRTDLQKVVSDAGEQFAAQSVAAQITHDEIQKRLRVQEEAIALVVASATDELGKLRAEVNRTSGFSGGADPWLASRQAAASPATSDPSSSSNPPGMEKVSGRRA